MIAAWPTKLALAPLLANSLKEQVRTCSLIRAGLVCVNALARTLRFLLGIGRSWHELNWARLVYVSIRWGWVRSNLAAIKASSTHSPLRCPQDQEALALLDLAWDLGINLLDTAPAYEKARNGWAGCCGNAGEGLGDCDQGG